jgi:hypothetical protein
MASRISAKEQDLNRWQCEEDTAMPLAKSAKCQGSTPEQGHRHRTGINQRVPTIRKAEYSLYRPYRPNNS